MSVQISDPELDKRVEAWKKEAFAQLPAPENHSAHNSPRMHHTVYDKVTGRDVRLTFVIERDFVNKTSVWRFEKAAVMGSSDLKPKRKPKAPASEPETTE